MPLLLLGLAVAGPAVSQARPVLAYAPGRTGMVSGCSTTSGFCFSPPTLGLATGSPVMWSNNTAATHTATDDGGAWTTGPVSPGQTVTVTFSTPGTFPYHCTFHPDMKGSIYISSNPFGMNQYHALSPSRLMDTRTTGQALAAGGSLNLPVTSGQVPSTAAAVVLNVTVTNTSGPGFLTVYPTGNPRPTASNLNWAAGETRPNLVTVPVGASGLVTFFASSRTDVIADLEGYFSSSSGSAGDYVPLAPGRLLDTRTASTTMSGGSTIDLLVTGVGGVPSAGAAAVALNVTVTDTSAVGFLTVYPTGAARPSASNLNWVAGWTVPNRVIVPVGAGGKVSFFNFAGATDLIVDVNGFFTDATATGKLFEPQGPVRIVDTRTSAQTLGPGGTLVVPVAGTAARVPNMAIAVILNVTATNPTTPGFLTLYPSDPRPTASDVNFVTGQSVPNAVVATLSSTGSVTIYNSSGSTDVVVDLVGWFG